MKSMRAAGSDIPRDLQAGLVEDIEVLSGLADEWDGLVSASDTPTSFFLTSMCILPFWKWYGQGRRLAVVAVRDRAGRLVGAAPFYAERVGRRLSRHWRLALLGSPESGADYLDVLARPGCREAVWRQTFRCLADRGVSFEAVNLNYILDDSPTLSLLRQGRGGLRFRVYEEPSSPCPFAALTPTWEEFSSSLGEPTRQGFRNRYNNLMRTFREVRFEAVSDEARVPEVIGILLEYKQARYGHRFDDDYAAWPDQAIAALRRGCLRLWVLWLDGEAACIWLSFQFNGRVFLQGCGYKPEFAPLSVGKVMMAHAVRAAIEEGASEYDLKRGNTAFKYHWADGERQTVQICAVRRNLRGAWIGFWEYGPLMANVRQWARQVNRRVRRGIKHALRPVATHCPAALPARLRERVLRPVGEIVSSAPASV